MSWDPSCYDRTPLALAVQSLNSLHDDYGFSWNELAENIGLSSGVLRHVASGNRTTDLETWQGHAILDFTDAVLSDPPRRYPVAPLLHLIDANETSRQQLLNGADRRLLLHARDRGWLSEWDADRLAVALGHTPHTIWGDDYEEAA